MNECLWLSMGTRSLYELLAVTSGEDMLPKEEVGSGHTLVSECLFLPADHMTTPMYVDREGVISW